MSTRRTRQELIEQGLLKEVQDSGKSALVIHLLFLHGVVCVGQRRGPWAIAPTHSAVDLSVPMAGTLYSQTAGV